MPNTEYSVLEFTEQDKWSEVEGKTLIMRDSSNGEITTIAVESVERSDPRPEGIDYELHIYIYGSEEYFLAIEYEGNDVNYAKELKLSIA